MELINNTTKTLKDDLSVEIKQGSKVSIAAACFSIYAFQELKEQLSQIEQLRFIFTSPTFVTEKAKKERREFYIPRMTRERSLYGTEFEIKLRNELTQKAIARECAEWIRQKVTFKSNISDKSIQGQIVVDGVGYTPINNFTTVELGCEKGNVISTTIVKDESLARTLLADFNEIWNDSKVLQVVTDEVIDSITAAYNENSPDFIYFVTLYNIYHNYPHKFQFSQFSKLEFVITFHTYWHSLQVLYHPFLIVPWKFLVTQVQHALFYIHNHLLFVLLYVHRQ